jgi:hypothetical protein
MTESLKKKRHLSMYIISGIESGILLERGFAPLFVCIKLRRISKTVYL